MSQFAVYEARDRRRESPLREFSDQPMAEDFASGYSFRTRVGTVIDEIDSSGNINPDVAAFGGRGNTTPADTDNPAVLQELDAAVERRASSRNGRRRQALAPTEDTSTAPAQCQCGCGESVARGSRFRPGHDAKLKSIILRIERWNDAQTAQQNDPQSEDGNPFAGLVEPTEAEIQQVSALHAQGLLGTCSCCGQPMFAHPSGMGPICRAGRCNCAERRERADALA